jgi:hypothetical protein
MAVRWQKEAKTMRTRMAVLVAGLGLWLTAVPVAAHHAFDSEFDAKKHVDFRGTVTKMEWIIPHAWIHMDVKKPDGTVEAWTVEAGTPNTLLRRGLTKDSLLPGTEIHVDGYQSKDGSLRATGRDLTLPNGQRLYLGAAGAGAPYGEKK